MTLLTKDQILQANDLKTADVEVPEWGGTVRVQTMTGSARDDYEQNLIKSRGGDKSKNLENVRALLLAATIVDEQGQLMFTSEDVKALGKKSVKAMDRVFAEASRLNALSDADVEDLAGN
jgi:hypothetical protein